MVSVISGFLILHQSMKTDEVIGCFIMFAAILLAQIPADGKEKSINKKKK